MPPNEPAPTAPFTDEDRTELAMLADDYDAVPNAHDGRLIARAAAYIEQLEARVARVHELLSLLDSWNVNHGPLDDPLPGNLIVSMMNTIGDPRAHGGPR